MVVNGPQVHGLRVCHIASGDRWAGAEAQVAALLRYLARRPDLHLSAILLNEGRLAEELRRAGIEVEIIPEIGTGFLRLTREAQARLRNQNVRILHSHRYKENLLAAIVARLCRVPHVVCSVHGSPEPFSGFRGMKQRFLHALNRLVLRFAADSVISVSAELCARLQHQVNSSKLLLVHNGIDPQRVRSPLDPVEARRRLGLPQDCLVVGTAGRLEPVKRLDLFLQAARQILHAHPNAWFLIAGEGSLAETLRQQARTLGLEDRALLLGHRDDIYDVLRACDLFLLCSDHEGLPMVLLEAMHLGVPVVARNVGGVPEVVVHKENGMLVNSERPDDLARACQQLLVDPQLRESLASAGSSWVRKRFTLETAASEVADLYHRLEDHRALG
ncbi:MAG: glycosyltransferase [Terriglobales bacterium]